MRGEKWIRGVALVCALLSLNAAWARGSFAPSQKRGGKPACNFVPSSNPVRVWYVSPSGKDSDDCGTRALPFGTILFAVKKARPGDIIRVQAGEYPESVVIGGSVEKGTAEAPITLLGEDNARITPKAIGTNKCIGTLVQVSKPYWIVEGFEIDVRGEECFGVSFTGDTTGSKLTHCTVHNGTLGAGISIHGNAQGVVIKDNHIHNFRKKITDSHGIVIQAPSQNVTIRNNEIRGNAGDAIQCENIDPSKEARGINIIKNKLHHNGENGVDIKTCKEVVIRDNTMSRFRKSETSAGEAIVIHYSAQDVLIEGNHISDAGRGISVGGSLVGGQPSPQNVMVYGNTITNIIKSGSSDGVGIRVENASDVDIVGNSISNTSGYGLMLGLGSNKNPSGGAALPSSSLTVTGNAIEGHFLVHLGRDPLRPNLKMYGNQYSSGGTFKSDTTEIQAFTAWLTASKVDQGSTQAP
ncbi:right-handed parallel beta-helix repeat-containing protein [Myxococcus stipitatus]|uniref:right-handed parallel beta-helix repeat-containing protein n=1 Tax=Myxococcus stipitatus TaxID=83455 RepID=UPI0030D61440